MRTTLTIDDTVLARAAGLAGLQSTSALVTKGLEALIREESARRLMALGGADPQAQAPPRRRPAAGPS
jgi:Arc/MetJ family transcription regulator